MELVSPARFRRVLDPARDIRYRHLVRSVRFESEETPSPGAFRVVARDLARDVTLPEEAFDFVVDCTGHFSLPHVPELPGDEVDNK